MAADSRLTVEEICPKALELDASGRAKYLAQACCDGTPHPYRVEHAGTIVNTPSAEEVRELNSALTAR